MGYEQIDLDFNPPNDKDSNTPKSNIISYSETLPKDGESDEEYALRSIDLARKIINKEVVVAEPTTDELNAELQSIKQSEKINKNEIVKEKDSKKVIFDSSTKAKMDQMKSRKDLDY